MPTATYNAIVIPTQRTVTRQESLSASFRLGQGVNVRESS